MLRVVLVNVLMFLLPFAVYAGYVYLTRRAEDDEASLLRDVPWLWLFLAGLLLVVGTMAAVISFSGAPPGKTYHPPRVEDGVVKPGYFD